MFQLFCEVITRHDTTVRLHGVGEPTLHTRFGELLRVIHQTDLASKFWLFTCGMFKPTLIPQLVESLGIIEVSINSHNEADFLKTKGIPAFPKVVDNVHKMREEIKKRGLRTRILLTRVQSDEQMDRDFVRHWREQGFECFVRSYHSYSGILSPPPPSDDPVILDNKTPKCLVPWRRLNLDGTLSDGQLVAVNCFNVLFQHPSQILADCVLGRFPEQCLSDLWNNKAFGATRKRLEMNLTNNTGCDSCSECLTDQGPRSENLIRDQEVRC